MLTKQIPILISSFLLATNLLRTNLLDQWLKGRFCENVDKNPPEIGHSSSQLFPPPGGGGGLRGGAKWIFVSISRTKLDIKKVSYKSCRLISNFFCQMHWDRHMSVPRWDLFHNCSYKAFLLKKNLFFYFLYLGRFLYSKKC